MFCIHAAYEARGGISDLLKEKFQKINNIQFSKYFERANKQKALHELCLAFRSSLFLMNNYKHTLFV